MMHLIKFDNHNWRPVAFRLIILLLLLLVSSLAVEPWLYAAEDFAGKRQKMIERDIRDRGIRDPKVLNAMSRIGRERFVDRGLAGQAYEDHPLPIGEGQTISQPYVVALMTEALKLKPGDRVLEIGTGSGYQAAVLAEIVSEVYTIEIRKRLTEHAERLLSSLGYRNIKVKYGDGYFGWEEHGPYDAIIVTAAANHIPPSLIRQLKEGGRLIIPLGSTIYTQILTIVTKKKGDLDVMQLGTVAFVPMVGEAEKKR
ncbi:Protein-L-isoaspartate O-methyltransferase 3 [Candidatus Sulfobium mesophilum]|uniref:Protein-L-isoaspartate O-methyltransferase n=1 Tax=Candidatus Sulfobium mesophilum TaxID=2016548 RepID=A0A2U3QGD9_9BACT|nr:Protein-L-isoaspartate O-methyltransferase 3 [Candidatus Sulfobium mesophilum]